MDFPTFIFPVFCTISPPSNFSKNRVFKVRIRSPIFQYFNFPKSVLIFLSVIVAELRNPRLLHSLFNKKL
nr:MAG TPA: hypothetical protein [Caudoviricetes sp.]